jgi:hypothetical protein
VFPASGTDSRLSSEHTNDAYANTILFRLFRIDGMCQGRLERTVLDNDQAGPAGISFGDLPWHVLETLMYYVLQLGDVDAVRSCRLVCKSWNAAGASMRPCLVLGTMSKPYFAQCASRRSMVRV